MVAVFCVLVEVRDSNVDKKMRIGSGVTRTESNQSNKYVSSLPTHNLYSYTDRVAPTSP